MSHFDLNMLYKHMTDFQPLGCYEHLNVSRYCTILYGVSYEPPSCILPPQANITFSCPKLFLSNICEHDTCSSVNGVSTAWLYMFHKILQCKRITTAANHRAQGPHKVKW